MSNTAIILAAGRGSRLKPLSDSMPKPLTEVNGVPILINALDNLERSGVQAACIVTGHLHDKIEETCGDRHGRMAIEYLVSSNFATTNNAVSLLLAREYLSGGTLLLEADVFFDFTALKKLLGKPGSAWAADYFTPDMNGCRLKADAAGKIEQLEIVRQSSIIPPERYKSAGMLKLDAPLAEKFIEWLEQETADEPNIFFDLVLGRHLGDAAISICNIHGLRWAEIDDIHDLRVAEQIFA